jgi:hypothetical protein
MDFNLTADLPHHIHHAAPAVKAAVCHAPVIVKQGYSMISMIVSSAVAAGIGFGLGWYIKGRGMTGVQNDLNNIKTDVENLKAKIFPAPAAA